MGWIASGGWFNSIIISYTQRPVLQPSQYVCGYVQHKIILQKRTVAQVDGPRAGAVGKHALVVPAARPCGDVSRNKPPCGQPIDQSIPSHTHTHTQNPYPHTQTHQHTAPTNRTMAKHAQARLQLHVRAGLRGQLREDGGADPVEAPRQVGEGLLARAAPLWLG